MEQIKEGMRVRVTYEGTVHYVSNIDGSFDYHYQDGGVTRTVRERELSGVEILALPPREWQDGAYYLNPNSGRVYQYDKGRDIFLNNEKEEFRFRHPVRDGFIKLVPEVES